MRARARNSVATLKAVLEGWDEVVAVGLLAPGDDVYDPYFALSLDVYTDGPVRGPDARRTAFGDVAAFESSTLTSKDRFLMGELPVRVEYKRIDRFEALVSAAVDGECLLRDAGTYAFHRLSTAEPLVTRGDWLEALRGRLDDLPERFWTQLRGTQEATLEHLYADLSAAAVRGDTFFFVVSAGRFLAHLCLVLFTINRRFEPAPRSLHDEALTLPVLPDSFATNLENFLNEDPLLTMTQRRELAQSMVTGVLSL